MLRIAPRLGVGRVTPPPAILMASAPTVKAPPLPSISNPEPLAKLTPPATVPSAALLVIRSTPPEMVVRPVYVLPEAPERTSVPVPALVRVRAPPVSLMRLETFNEAAPVLLVTVQDWFPFRIRLLSLMVWARAVVVGRVTVIPPVPRVSAPAPSAMVKAASRLMVMPATETAVLIVAMLPAVPKVSVDVPPVSVGLMLSFQLLAVLIFVFAPPPSQMVPAKIDCVASSAAMALARVKERRAVDRMRGFMGFGVFRFESLNGRFWNGFDGIYRIHAGAIWAL